ncbi:hypothetical protein [Actinocorallia longicatena]|uniref:Uncharacterized protein n=1 Tax=Actinocorallia longicatena TaxID=111803 RepID=A0ABP6Q849_9ACTN
MLQEHTQGTPGLARTKDGRELFYTEPPGPGDGRSTPTVVLVAPSGGGPIVRKAAAERPGRVAGLVLAEATGAHRSRAALSRRGRHIIADGSGHMVILTAPDLVAREVRHLLTP